MKLKYINYGMGNRVGETIYLHKKLKKFPELHDAILKHERNHTDNWNLKDVMIDISNKELKGKKIEFYKFILTTPSSWINFFPVMKLDDNWCFDLSLMIFYLIVFGIFWNIYFLVRFI